jgi:polyhydroxyalkanoate synthesis repressor PhaR
MTIIIKRYQNRKLYDTSAKHYITLDGIADLIRRGNNVQIIDNVTEEDLTSVTLMQVIMEEEKKKSGFLPLSLLIGLIQAGENIWNGVGIPSHGDIEELKKQLDILEEKLNSLQEEK